MVADFRSGSMERRDESDSRKLDEGEKKGKMFFKKFLPLTLFSTGGVWMGMRRRGESCGSRSGKTAAAVAHTEHSSQREY